jgi:signal transduction histidine kinase
MGTLSSDKQSAAQDRDGESVPESLAPAKTSELDSDHLRRLIEVGRGLLADIRDPEAVLDHVLETAAQITGARFAALGILDESRQQLERFLTRGIDAEGRQAIGDLPRGRGILGILIEDPQPLRLSRIGDHPKSYGFPAGHPPMKSFLGVPVLIRGEVWGNLYLTDKAAGDFTVGDEESAVILASWAAIAIENARLYQTVESRRGQLERAVMTSEAAGAITAAIGAETNLDRILELIVKRGRALLGARSVVLFLHEGAELVVAAKAGQATPAEGVRVPIDGSTAGEVLTRGAATEISDAGSLKISPADFGVDDAHSAVLAPLIYRGRPLGVLAAFDSGEDSPASSDAGTQVLEGFAASAAIAVAVAQSAQEDRLRHSLDSAEAERKRWARELHDETLQGLAAVRMLLSGALRDQPEAEGSPVLRDAIGQIEDEIANLRTIITELRPAALDELGVRPAIEALIDRRRTTDDLEVDLELALPQAGSEPRLTPELETAVYRLLQEAMTNISKHAGAKHVAVRVLAGADTLEVEVSDDGAGFDPDSASAGFGLVGMRERIALAGGSLTITRLAPGTRVHATLPAQHVDTDTTGDHPASGR